MNKFFCIKLIFAVCLTVALPQMCVAMKPCPWTMGHLENKCDEQSSWYKVAAKIWNKIVPVVQKLVNNNIQNNKWVLKKLAVPVLFQFLPKEIMARCGLDTKTYCRRLASLRNDACAWRAYYYNRDHECIYRSPEYKELNTKCRDFWLCSRPFVLQWPPCEKESGMSFLSVFYEHTAASNSSDSEYLMHYQHAVESMLKRMKLKKETFKQLRLCFGGFIVLIGTIEICALTFIGWKYFLRFMKKYKNKKAAVKVGGVFGVPKAVDKVLYLYIDQKDLTDLV